MSDHTNGQPPSDGRGLPRHQVPTSGAVTVDADGNEIPVDLAAWIDDRDPAAVTAAPDRADGGDALEEQRAVHEPDGRDADEGVGALVNNVGDDGGAASG